MAKAKQWLVRGRESIGNVRAAELAAYWEVDGDPISDDYTPDEISAADLFGLWARKALKHFPNGLVPIHWFLDGSSAGLFECMPYAYPHLERDEDYLTYYFPPEPADDSDEVFNWLALPVMDKRWNAKQADKGGFIQEATGWKPAVLTPFLYLPTLQAVVER